MEGEGHRSMYGSWWTVTRLRCSVPWNTDSTCSGFVRSGEAGRGKGVGDGLSNGWNLSPHGAGGTAWGEPGSMSRQGSGDILPPPLPTALPWSCSLNRYSHRLVGDVCDPCRSVLQDGQCVRVIKEHTEAIHAIALEQSSPPVLATGGDDRTIRLWNAQVCVSGTG